MGMLLCQEALGETRRGREQACSHQHSCKKRRTHCDYSKFGLPRVDGFRSRPYVYSRMGWLLDVEQHKGWKIMEDTSKSGWRNTKGARHAEGQGARTGLKKT